jgi:hypothetical protein
MPLRLLAWVLTGDSRKTDVVAPLVKPVELKGCARFSARLMLCPQDMSQRKKLDNFEGEACTMAPVQVTVVGEEGQMVDADIYLWNSERVAVSVDRWDLDTFIRDRLNDWIELFADGISRRLCRSIDINAFTQNLIACEEDSSGLSW